MLADSAGILRAKHHQLGIGGSLGDTSSRDSATTAAAAAVVVVAVQLPFETHFLSLSLVGLYFYSVLSQI